MRSVLDKLLLKVANSSGTCNSKGGWVATLIDRTQFQIAVSYAEGSRTAATIALTSKLLAFTKGLHEIFTPTWCHA